MLFNTAKLRLFITSLFITLGISACGGGDSSSGSGVGLQCDLNSSYTAAIAPDTSRTTNPYIATVIVLHGKNGSPYSAHLQQLKNDLNALGYDAILPQMPWHGVNWDGTYCDAISYLNNLITAEVDLGNPVILLGHSLGGNVALSYSAMGNTTQPDALTVLAPGHFIHLSRNLANAHASSIQRAQNMVAVGNGNVVSTFQTSNGGTIRDIYTTPIIYLSFHDKAQFPGISSSIPSVSVPMLWLAGDTDPLTAVADNTFGITSLIPRNGTNLYKVIPGDHISMVYAAATELNQWFTPIFSTTPASPE